MTDRSTEALLAGCRRGDEADLRAFYERYYSYALSVCLAYAANREDAAEILNDGFMKAFHGIGTLQSPDGLLPWLRRIMVNTALNHHRKHRRRRSDVSTEAIEHRLMEPNLNDEAVYAHLSAEEIIRALQRLPSTYRVVFSLYVLEGYAHREIAEQLRIAESTSRAHLTEANRLLRTLLKNIAPEGYDRLRR